MRPFHIAFPVHDLVAARAFYGGTMGCPEGRSSDHWIDFDLYGHQIVAHLDAASHARGPIHNPVDGHDVPVPHFGVILDRADWDALAARLTAAGTAFVIAPYVRFAGEAGAGHDVLPRSQRQRARVQELRQRRHDLRDLSLP